jgi:hypothetical protein
MTMRGAKSNASPSRRAIRNRICPRLALVIRTTLGLRLSVAISGANCSVRENDLSFLFGMPFVEFFRMDGSLCVRQYDGPNFLANDVSSRR